MKTELKLDFVDFWPGFEKENNLFTKFLHPIYTIIISKNPDFLFFSCFGYKHTTYCCPKLFYTGENRITPRFIADYSITFEHLPASTHYYFPYFGYNLLFYGGVEDLTRIISRQEAMQLWEEKSKFCCTVVSNPLGAKRNQFFKLLSKRKKVDSGGRHWNNIGGVVENKYDFINDYKFVFAFENQAHPGYVTEKLADALRSKGIPIYYGDSCISETFNKKRFLFLEDFASMEQLAEYVVALSKNRDKYISIICEPNFS